MTNTLTKPGEHQKNKDMLKHTLQLFLIVFSALSNPAHAAWKFALLIGNSAYSGADVLCNPGRDVDLLADTGIGKMYCDGEGVKTDYQNARQYFEKGTSVGNLRARMGMVEYSA